MQVRILPGSPFKKEVMSNNPKKLNKQQEDKLILAIAVLLYLDQVEDAERLTIELEESRARNRKHDYLNM